MTLIVVTRCMSTVFAKPSVGLFGVSRLRPCTHKYHVQLYCGAVNPQDMSVCTLCAHGLPHAMSSDI